MRQARSQDFSWEGGGCVCVVKVQISRGVQGHAPPTKF